MRKAIYFNKDNEDLIEALVASRKMEVFSDYVCGLIRADLLSSKQVETSDIKAQLERVESQLFEITKHLKPLEEVESKASSPFYEIAPQPVFDPGVSFKEEITEKSTESKVSEDKKRSLFFA